MKDEICGALPDQYHMLGIIALYIGFNWNQKILDNLIVDVLQMKSS